MGKRISVALFVATSVLLLGIIITKSYKKPRYLNYREGEVSQQREKIDKFIKVIKKESLDESIEQLIRDREQFVFPGFYSQVKFAQIKLERMLSSRRTIKVLQSFKKLSRNEQEPKCKEFFYKVFKAHTNALCVNIKRKVEPTLPIPATGETQLALCAAMFTTADLGLRETLAEEFTQLDRFQEDTARIVGGTTNSQSLSHWVELFYFPDARFQVNLLRTFAANYNNGEKLAAVDDTCIQAQMAKGEIPIVAWNAGTTYFERLVGSHYDTNKGVTMYPVYGWSMSIPDDSQAQDLFVKRLRKMLLE
jgi:hypothetical protein